MTAGYSGKLNHVNLQWKERNLPMVDLQAGKCVLSQRGDGPTDLQGLHISTLKDV